MTSKKQTTAERFGIEKRVFAAKICYYDIEGNGKQAGATADYKSLAAAYKRVATRISRTACRCRFTCSPLTAGSNAALVKRQGLI